MQLDGGSKFLPIIKSNPSIQFHISYPYTPQHNGLVKRRHRHIVELSLASMFQAQIPYQVLFSKAPDYKLFKVLGCRCFSYTRPYAANKLAPRSAYCVFLGYSTTYKGYKCLHLPTNKIYISRHVLFDENYFPFKETSSVSPSSSSLQLKILPHCLPPCTRIFFTYIRLILNSFYTFTSSKAFTTFLSFTTSFIYLACSTSSLYKKKASS
jgi:hypothetical protein